MNNDVPFVEEIVGVADKLLRDLDNDIIPADICAKISNEYLIGHGIFNNNGLLKNPDIVTGMALGILYLCGRGMTPAYITDPACVSMVRVILDRVLEKVHGDNCKHCNDGK